MKTGMSLRERRVAFCIITLHIVLISLPYLWAFHLTPAGQSFGWALGNIEDQNVHLSWARQAADGTFFFRNLFTTEDIIVGQNSHYTNILCVLIGVLSRFLHLPLVLVYHVFRVIFAAMALWWFYRLCFALTNDRRARLLALALAAFASGMGWICSSFALWGEKPFDTPGTFLMPEAFTFTSALFFPLFIVPIALLALTFGLLLKTQIGAASTRTRSFYLILGAGTASFLLAHIHPYDALPLIVAMLLRAALEIIVRYRQPQRLSRATGAALLVIIMTTLIAAAQQWFALQTPAFRGAAQFIAPPPKPIYLLLTYGIFLALAAYGAWTRRGETGTRMMACWALSCLACMYLPFPVAGKLIEGSHLPLCFLVAVAVVAMSRDATRGRQAVLVAGVLGLFCISSVNIVAAILRETQESQETRFKHLRPPIYLTGGEQRALEFLNSLPASRKAGAVLCPPHLGNYVPRASGLHVYVGHPAYTINFQEKFQRTLAFFNGLAPDREALAWLRENSIEFVLEGPDEKLWASIRICRLPSQQLHLQRVFHDEDTDIFVVGAKLASRNAIIG